jgi:hypothetical protein
MITNNGDRCGQTSGKIGSCKLSVTKVRRSLAVHFVVLVDARVFDPFLASRELVDENDLKISNLNTNN